MLPDWLRKRYDLLWKSFKQNPFTFDEAKKLLMAENHDSENQINVFLAELRNHDYIITEKNEKDARKRIYKLVPFTDVQEPFSPQGSRSDLYALLKQAADLIRTRVDYTYILLLLFYKRICDKWKNEYEKEYDAALSDGLTKSEAHEEAKRAAYHDFDIPEEFLWKNLREESVRLPERLSEAMKKMAERNPKWRIIFENADFLQFTQSQENAEILRQLVELFSSKSLDAISSDILGDAYEWILRYFAPTKAKEGEVYTPREVIRLMVEMLSPQPNQSVYDPACGSAGMLTLSYKHVLDEHGPDGANKLFLFGQESNFKTIALAEINLYLHDIKNAMLNQGDTLLFPKFKEKEKLRKFDMVIANPPWNQDGYEESTLKKGEFWRERFSQGFPTKQSADWAWIQHMLTSADDKGKVAIVMDNGALFRGGKEKNIRKSIADNYLLECVILLPEKLFYNTGAPGAIIIFNRAKPKNMLDKILFINASTEYEQHPDVRKLNRLGDEHIEKIADAYREFSTLDGFSRVVALDEIRENDYNLNVTLYVFPEEEVEEINLDKEWSEIRKLEDELQKIEKKIGSYLEEVREGERV